MVEIRRYSDKVNLFARWLSREWWKVPSMMSYRMPDSIYIRNFGEDVRLFTDFRPLRGDVWWMNQ